MKYSISDVEEVISANKEFCRMLKIVPSVCLVEYDGTQAIGSKAIAAWLEENDIPKDKVRQIVLMGRNNPSIEFQRKELMDYFPDAEYILPNKKWNKSIIKDVRIRCGFVIHFGAAISVAKSDAYSVSPIEKEFFRFVNATRYAYNAIILKNDDLSFSDSNLAILCNIRLNGFQPVDLVDVASPKQYCLDKTRYIENCIKTLIPKDAFSQCMEEVNHGCEECNLCDTYGEERKCPKAQCQIANFYRDGFFVSRNDQIAHQWYRMATYQGYAPARKLLADDLKDGIGCKRDVEKAFYLYTYDVLKNNGKEYIQLMLDMCESDEEKLRIVPYIAAWAANGDEDMTLLLSHALQKGEMGLPKDMVQQEEWITKGANNGNPRFMLSLAEMYEENEAWKDAYLWYKKLVESKTNLSDDIEYVSTEKLSEIKLRMLTDGASDEEVANKGENYLFGYFGYERNLDLALTCLKYASEKNVAKAKGLLGLMYYEGLGVEKDELCADTMINEAANEDDLRSIYWLYAYGGLHVGFDEVENAIKIGIEKGQPFAYYFQSEIDIDDSDSFINCLKAAEGEIPVAQYKLALMFKNGLGTKPNEGKYLMWLEKAAHSGYYKAKGEWGMKQYGNPMASRSLVFSMLRDAYEQGYEDVCLDLGTCYLNGSGTERNKVLGYELYIKAAERGNYTAQEVLCREYFNGNDVLKQSYENSARWGEEAIKQGSRTIRFETAYSLCRVGKKDRSQELYLELSNEGNSTAMNNYACGLTDQSEALEWFIKSSNAGSDYGAWNAGKHYRDGNGIEKNIEKAIEFLTISSRRGNDKAMQDLGDIFLNEFSGDEEKVSQGIHWIEKAVEQNNVSAMMELALIYKEGNLVKQDIEKTLLLYRRAAEKENINAFVCIGEIYESGIGIQKDLNTAIYWYRRAASKNNISAKLHLKRLNVNWLDDDKVVNE